MIDKPTTIDAQAILEIYNPTVKDSPQLHLLVFIPDSWIDENGEAATHQLVKIKAGGAVKPHHVLMTGLYIPLLLNQNVPLKHGNDHYAGCSKLDYSTHPELVNTYADFLDRIYRNKTSPMYSGMGSLEFTINRDDIDALKEGMIPVLVNGKSIFSNTVFENHPAYIITGNCV